jgi:hypothetical protein
MNRQLPKEKYLVIRLALWLISVIIALLPALYEFRGWQEMSLGENFSDLLFVVVPVSALALSTTIDYLCVGFPDLSTNEFFNSLCSLLLNSIGLISALTGFVSIEKRAYDGPSNLHLQRTDRYFGSGWASYRVRCDLESSRFPFKVGCGGSGASRASVRCPDHDLNPCASGTYSLTRR